MGPFGGYGPLGIRRSGGAGAGSIPDWSQILTTTEGVTPFDGASETTTGTGFVDGVATLVHPTGLVTIRDGYQEDLPRWSIPILTLFPTYNHLDDAIELAMRIDDLPLSATVEKFGIWFGILNKSVASRASATGQAWGITPNTSSAWNHGPINETSDALGNVMTGTPEWLVARFAAYGRTTDAGFDFGSYCRAINTLGAPEASDAQSPAAMDIASNPVSGWTVQFGGLHNTTTGTAGPTNRFAMFARLIPTGGLTGLP